MVVVVVVVVVATEVFVLLRPVLPSVSVRKPTTVNAAHQRHIRVQHHDVVLKHYPTYHATLRRPLSATIVFIPYTAALDIRLSIDRSILQSFRRRLVRHALLMVGLTKCNKDCAEGFLGIRLQRIHFFLSTATNHALLLAETKILGRKST